MIVLWDDVASASNSYMRNKKYKIEEESNSSYTLTFFEVC